MEQAIRIHVGVESGNDRKPREPGFAMTCQAGGTFALVQVGDLTTRLHGDHV